MSPLLSLDGAKATITLNRPEHHNRIDPDDIPVIHAHLDAVESDPVVQLLVAFPLLAWLVSLLALPLPLP